MPQSYIWVHKLAQEVNNQTGFVECDSEIADLLIEQGKAQNPDVGALHLLEIDLTETETKVVAAKKTSRKKTEELNDK